MKNLKDKISEGFYSNTGSGKNAVLKKWMENASKNEHNIARYINDGKVYCTKTSLTIFVNFYEISDDIINNLLKINPGQVLFTVHLNGYSFTVKMYDVTHLTENNIKKIKLGSKIPVPTLEIQRIRNGDEIASLGVQTIIIDNLKINLK